MTSTTKARNFPRSTKLSSNRNNHTGKTFLRKFFRPPTYASSYKSPIYTSSNYGLSRSDYLFKRRVPHKRSKLVAEFGLNNKHGHLNCFLNVCLQSLWQFPSVRVQIQFLLETTKDTRGSTQL